MFDQIHWVSVALKFRPVRWASARLFTPPRVRCVASGRF